MAENIVMCVANHLISLRHNTAYQHVLPPNCKGVEWKQYS